MLSTVYNLDVDKGDKLLITCFPFEKNEKRKAETFVWEKRSQNIQIKSFIGENIAFPEGCWQMLIVWRGRGSGFGKEVLITEGYRQLRKSISGLIGSGQAWGIIWRRVRSGDRRAPAWSIPFLRISGLSGRDALESGFGRYLPGRRAATEWPFILLLTLCLCMGFWRFPASQLFRKNTPGFPKEILFVLIVRTCREKPMASRIKKFVAPIRLFSMTPL